MQPPYGRPHKKITTYIINGVFIFAGMKGLSYFMEVRG